MSPPKFSSLRYSKRRPSSLIPFRDDLGLVGFRYEKTVQAEPPIPIPARKSLSRTSSFVASSPTSSFTIPSSPPISPPAEEHPAFRSDFSSEESRDEWRSDSGAARTTSTTTTIYEEDFDATVLYDKELGLAADDSTVAPGVAEHVELAESKSADARASCNTVWPVFSGKDSSPPPQARAPPPLSSRTILSQEPSKPTSQSVVLPSTDATSTASSPRKLARSFSLRVMTGNRLRKRSMSEMGPRDGSISATSGETRSGKCGDGASWRQGLGQSSPDAATAMGDANKGHHAPANSSQRPTTNHDRRAPDTNFSPISVSIPTDSLLEEDFLTSVSFSKRGSLMFGGKRAFPTENMATESSQLAVDAPEKPPRAFPLVTTKKQADDRKDPVEPPSTADDAPANDATEVAPAKPRSTPSVRVLSADVERDSQKVRSLYEVGDAINWEQGAPAPASAGERLSSTPEDPVKEDKHDTPARDKSPDGAPAPERATSNSVDSSQLPDLVRREYELAGGVEDWEDVDGADVDRYGFIRPRHLSPPTERVGRPTSRRRNLLSRREPSELNSARTPNRKVSAKSLHTQTSGVSAVSVKSSLSALRQATNYLPHNRGRRMADEAGEMLTHAPGLQHITEDAKADKISEAVKRKEWERAEKWRRMAKVVSKGKNGEGMGFEFDIKHPKLVDRTWKGIPDRWRAAAWYSFLATSAKENKDAPSEEHLINEFQRLQHVSCEEDVQIDLDVPRTVNQHIMFRRRYRGGQRLLFRVLHAVALYHSEVGYVQGMASLGATLLCYFDEERAFVMLVRMWQLRGLKQLYDHGFEGLMACLGDFEKRWLAGKEVAKKLNDLGIDATAFGTKWYLTLFNLSVPFPAQLRIWDVFLLLGSTPSEPKQDGSPAGLDVLHAASAAVIDALTEIILDSDFENTMKVLTSWIPIKDENLLMKVARAELKYHGRKKA